MLVICAGMYRACSTWQYEVVAHLIERHRNGRRLGYLTGDEFARQPPSALAPEPTDGGWAVLKSHEGHPAFTRAIRSGRARVLTSWRDVRDVVDSLRHKRGLGFDAFIRQGLAHQILVNDRYWRRQPGVLGQRYEDLIADPAGGVAAIARFLGIALAPGEASEIAAAYSLEANRQRTAALAERLRAAGVDLDDPNHTLVYERDSLLHWNHLRDGRVGGWRDRSTPSERAVLGWILGGWLIAHGYEQDRAWAEPISAGPVERIRTTGLLLRGRLACLARSAAVTFPAPARILKALLGMKGAAGTATPVDVILGAPRAAGATGGRS